MSIHVSGIAVFAAFLDFQRGGERVEHSLAGFWKPRLCRCKMLLDMRSWICACGVASMEVVAVGTQVNPFRMIAFECGRHLLAFLAEILGYMAGTARLETFHPTDYGTYFQICQDFFG